MDDVLKLVGEVIVELLFVYVFLFPGAVIKWSALNAVGISTSFHTAFRKRRITTGLLSTAFYLGLLVIIAMASPNV